MEWRVPGFSRENRTVLHTVLALILSLLFFFSGEGLSGAAANVVTTIFYFPFHQVQGVLTRLGQTAHENEMLRTRMAELSSQLQFYNETIEENRRLRALLGFLPPPGFRIVPTEIIGVYGSGIPNTALINLGERHAVRVNQAVITRNGVAGRVARVLKDYSVVYLLTEPRCRVAVRIQRSREQGIIRYSLRRGMYLDNVPRSDDVVVGDTVITSGVGGIFPEGLVVGEIVNVASPEREFFFDITVQPAVNFNGLDELYVLVPEG
jgi:rod shape-determining protein MreC